VSHQLLAVFFLVKEKERNQRKKKRPNQTMKKNIKVRRKRK
jgi:hypothetical protein